jgi:hypothetical protein
MAFPTVDQAFIKQYDADVFEAFQRKGSKMLAACRLKDRLNGQSVYFQKVGKGTATQKSRHGVVPVMNQSHTPVECPVSDFYAGDWIDRLDELKINIDERMVVANAGAWALGRKVDDQVIAAIMTALPAGQLIANGGVGATKAKFLNAIEILNTADVPDDGQRFGYLGPHQWNEMLNLQEFANALYTGPGYPWLDGQEIRRWMGVMWVRHSGLTVAASVRSCLIWHKTAVGYARGMEVTTDITWHGDRAAHFVNSMMSGGSIRIEDTGAVQIDCMDNSVIS